MLSKTKTLAWSMLCSLILPAISAEMPGIDVPGPETVAVAGATSPQGAYSGSHTIKQAIDGSMESPNWHVPGKDEISGEFSFAGPEGVDYMVFHNASFSKLDLAVKVKGQWKELGTQELKSDKLLRFAKRMEGVEAVRITIKGDKGFSLRELGIHRIAANPYAEVMAKVFKDTSCSQLKAGVRAADIDALPALLKVVAQKLKSNDYGTPLDREFRIASYKAYSNPEYAAKERNINALSPLDNPTGIVAGQDEEIVVLVGPTWGQAISLASVSPYGIATTAYPLAEGINKIKVTRPGLLYVMYHADLATGAKAPINVHIPLGSGKVNGYFDIARHKDADWKRMIAAAPHEMFDIVGKYSMMILDTKYLRQYTPESITESVGVWDDSVKAMWKIMGFDLERRAHNNRQLGVATSGGAHMFATWYYCGYSLGTNGQTMNNEVIAPGVLQGKRLWGIGHEIGHCYQHPINWRSMSESSNNFFAQLILDQVVQPRTGNEEATDMENPCKYLLEDVVKGKHFHDINGWAKWGFAQYSFYLYFHKLGIDPKFYPTLFASLRKKPLSDDPYEISKAHLAWYERICEHAKLDFTEDFETFNWFEPINIKGHQYGDYSFVMTREMADAAKARIAAKRYPKPKYRVAFIHQHGKVVDLWGQKLKGSELNGYWTKYKADGKLADNVSAAKEGNRVKVTGGENAAAFCVKTDGKIVGYYDRQQFDVNGIPWNATSEVYAIPMQTAQPYKLIYSEKKKG